MFEGLDLEEIDWDFVQGRYPTEEPTSPQEVQPDEDRPVDYIDSDAYDATDY